jgi:phosphoribosylanthranilate isomerase
MMWLAPRIPPGRELDLAFLPLADFFLMDTFDPHHVGGSGKTGDWLNFKRLMSLYQKVGWILAGGLNPDNVAEAVQTSGAKRVDVNSGIESAPGVKDHAKMKAFFDNLAAAQP